MRRFFTSCNTFRGSCSFADIRSPRVLTPYPIKAFDPMDLAEFLLASWEGAILRMTVDRSPAALDRFKNTVFQTEFIFQTVFKGAEMTILTEVALPKVNILGTGKMDYPPAAMGHFGLTTDRTGQTGMYGPPLCRKRKMRVTGFWSAQMYSALLEHKAHGHDGMRCAPRPI
jgi:hypothetical protein